MKKSDLRNGMICETGDHDLGMVLGDRIVFQDCVLMLSYIDENLCYKYRREPSYNTCTIIAVYEVEDALDMKDVFNKCSLEALWKREEIEIKKVVWHEVPQELKRQLENYTIEE